MEIIYETNYIMLGLSAITGYEKKSENEIEEDFSFIDDV